MNSYLLIKLSIVFLSSIVLNILQWIQNKKLIKINDKLLSVKKIAVLTAQGRVFKEWINKELCPTLSNGCNFIWIHDMESAYGHTFVDVVYLYGYEDIKNVNDVIYHVKIHTKPN